MKPTSSDSRERPWPVVVYGYNARAHRQYRLSLIGRYTVEDKVLLRFLMRVDARDSSTLSHEIHYE